MQIKQALAVSSQLTSPSALTDIRLLLAHVLAWPLSRLLAYPEYQLTDMQNQLFAKLLKQRQAGTPIAYLIEQASFWSLELYVNPSCLIPRPETEVLVETVLNLAANEPLKVLDLGTGSGAISIALARERDNWQITGVDKSSEALLVAQRNCARYQLENIKLLQSDWLSNVAGKFKIIVANPPYIAADDTHLSALEFEPQSALVAADNGLADLAKIISQAPHYLAHGGYLCLEHGYEQADAVGSLLAQADFSEIVCYQDLAANPRVSVGYCKN